MVNYSTAVRFNTLARRRHGVTWAYRVPLWALVCLSLAVLTSADNDDSSNKREPQKLISLAESIRKSTNSLQDPTVEEIRKQYWQKTLADIRNISFGFSANGNRGRGGGLGHQWKWGVEENPIGTTSLSNETIVSNGISPVASLTDATNLTIPTNSNSAEKRRRFEGFMSWERMLQEWADDVQEYLDQVERESEGADYAFGNFGRGSKADAIPEKTEETTTEDISPVVDVNKDLEKVSIEAVDEFVSMLDIPASETATTPDNAEKSMSKKSPLPIPAPAQPGEAVLAHTDLSDLSKRVEIVTTAALPWRTGTAVNPLLRAAYLTHGRAQAGGSVTLMLPWLERKADQEKVYGPSQTFESPSEQEAYIRDWLRDTANMPEAATDLRIRWYTAWQNPAENSIYSMGDITALIPPDEVDICILEEPEHLNWYRAPGENWTKRFKHVVGILHTSMYFLISRHCHC